jgi:hypothetical protein
LCISLSNPQISLYVQVSQLTSSRMAAGLSTSRALPQDTGLVSSRQAGLLRPEQSAPRFGRFNRVIEHVFKPITEDYFWGFLARDILGLWAPRIIVSLKRGRIPYDKTKDPDYGTRGPVEQKLHQWRQDIKGLNFWNGWEETAREVQSGPGWMVAHAALFGISMSQVAGKRALMMSHNELKHFFGLLSQAISPEDLAKLHTLPAPRQREVMLKAFLRKALSPNMAVAKQLLVGKERFSNVNLKFSTPSEAQMIQWVQKQFGKHFRDRAVPGDRVFEAWISHYTTLLRNPKQSVSGSKALTTLEHVFEELVDRSNTRARRILSPLDISAIRIQSATNPRETVRMTAQQFVNALNKFSTALGEITKQIHPAQPLDRSLLSGLLEKIRRQIVHRKFILSPLATLLGGGLAFYVAAISQSEARKYPANRLIPLPKHATQSGQSSVLPPLHPGHVDLSNPRGPAS